MSSILETLERPRVISSWQRVRDELLAERGPDGHWVGELASSALATATAVSAVSIYLSVCGSDESRRPKLLRLIHHGLQTLRESQNTDGGWGDTDRSFSNISTTMLVRAAFACGQQHGNGAIGDDQALQGAEAYIEQVGGINAVRRRYGRDKTFAIPILTNCALADQVAWPDVAALPFELATVPQRFYHLLRLPVVSYAIPALVAIGQAKFHFDQPKNPILRALRRAAIAPSLRVLEQMQPASGGFLEAIPLTSFVLMSLAASGRHQHPVVQSGLDFLIGSVREDGSWPIDTNLAVWNTTLAINGLGATVFAASARDAIIDWLLKCQYKQRHPYTGAAPGGWGWSDLTGAVPDADDTPGALLALSELSVPASHNVTRSERVKQAAAAGVVWLVQLQNRDGGWPTFCRGWGTLPFDRSGSDLTAHALRALQRWRTRGVSTTASERAMRRGLRFLLKSQRSDGTWVPLWFGNQHHADEENPVYGTAKALIALDALGLGNSEAALRGRAALSTYQNLDGGFCGGGPPATKPSALSSVEETALAVEALATGTEPSGRAAWVNGLTWLMERVETGGYRDASPIGFYFAKLWYHERLYPMTFTAAALRRAVELIAPEELT